MKKILIIFLSIISFSSVYAVNSKDIFIAEWINPKYTFEVKNVYPLPFWENIEYNWKDKIKLEWDLSNYETWSLSNLKLYYHNWDFDFKVLQNYLQWEYISNEKKYKVYIDKTWVYTLMSTRPNPEQDFSIINLNNSYLWDWKSIYNIKTSKIYNTDWSLINDGYSFWISLLRDTIDVEEDENTIYNTWMYLYEVKTKDGILNINFKAKSKFVEENITIYDLNNKNNENILYLNQLINIKPIQIILPKVEFNLINNKVSFDSSIYNKYWVQWYNIYLKALNWDYLPFYWNKLNSIYLDWKNNNETIINFSSWDKYYIQISAYDVFWNESEKSDPILFDWSVNCVDETLCRPTNYNPVEVDSTNSSPIKENITQDSDIITPYFSNYKNINSIKESQVYKNIYLNKWNLLKQEIDLKEWIPFKRYYNSNPALINSKIWLGWNHNYDAYFDYNDNWNISVILHDWTFSRFTLDKDFNYITSDNAWLKVKDELNNIIITNIVWDIYTFSKNKQRLEKVQYKNYPEFNLVYDKEDKIISVSSVWNCKSELKFEYNTLNGNLSKIFNNKWQEISYNYDLKTLWNDAYLFLDEIKYDENNSISYNYNNAWLLTWDNDFRYRFDNNKVTDFQDLENNKYFQVVYSGSIVNIFEKDEMYKKILSEQKIELNNSWSILNISIQAWIIEYNYTSSWILESIKDEKWNIKKIENTFGEFKCSWNITSTSVWNKNTDKIQKVIDKVDNYINKKTKWNPNDEIKTIRKSFIDKISLLKTPEKIIDKGIYKKELNKLVKDLQSAIKRDVKNIN